MGAEDLRGADTEQRDTQLRFAVLGPVRAWRGDQPLSTGSPQQRALLAALLLRGARTATAEELIDAIWGEESPEQAKAALRTYASRIRKSLGADADLLVSESGGYAMRTGGEFVLDLDTAQDLATHAEKAASCGDHLRARDLYNNALAEWDGEPLAHVPGPYADTHRTRLEEWRLGLLEHRLDLDLQTGCHAEAVSELTALTAAHPLRERLRELLMLALYRSGRQAEALAVYADTRRLLTDELGVDPRPELADLQQRILEADEELAYQTDATSESSTVTVTRPAQLPATVADFTGRTSFVSELSDQLAEADGTVMAVSAVAGIGGVGKTTLAIHVAHEAADRFPDGQLYVDLQGAGSSPADPEAVLGSFLRALGTQDSVIPENLEDRSALFRSLLTGRRILTLLDNARDAAQIRPLLPGSAGCAALVTSRVRMVDLAGAHLVDLDVMSPEEAMALFTRIVGDERVLAERKAVMDVVAACGFLPLAIRIAASRLAARRTWTVSVLARKLADERRRLDELQVGDQAVKASFELGYGQLDAEQGRAFRLLGMAEGPDISVAAAAALVDRDADTTEGLLESLVDTSLLESAAPGRYRFHDLVRLFARACAERDEQPPRGREEALQRLSDFYLATACQVFAMGRPGERTVNHLKQTQCEGLSFSDQDTAVDWLFAEADCLLSSVRQSASAGRLREAVDLLFAVKDLGDSGLYSILYERSGEAVRDAARKTNDTFAEARAQNMLTHVHFVAGRFKQAAEEAQRALILAEACDDVLSRCYALNDRSMIAYCQNRFQEAEEYHRPALEAFRADGNLPSVASALCILAHIHIGLDRTESAIELAEQGLEIYQELGHLMRVANARNVLGRALTRADRIPEALDQFKQALELFHESRQPLWEGVIHFRIAETLLVAQRPAQSASHAEQALALRGIGGEWMRAKMLAALGRALDQLGQQDRARVCWSDALSILEEQGSPEAVEVRKLLTSAAAA